MKAIIAACLVLGIAGCAGTQPDMGASVHEMMQAQTDMAVSADNVGGSMAGIGDHVGAAYRSDVDRPREVKDTMNIRFIKK